MSPTIIFFVVAVIMLFIGVPVAPTLGLASVLFVTMSNLPVSVIVQRMFAGLDIVAMLCIPFFILAGDLMAKGGIAKRLVRVSNLVVGNVTGGLAFVTIIVCALFAAMTGSAMACCVTVGAIMLPYMIEAGYSKEFSTAVFSAGAVLGPIIPPSTAMIIYSVSAETSVTKLYKLGIPAGILLAVALMIISYFICKRSGFKGMSRYQGLDMKEGEKLTFGKVCRIVLSAVPALGSPVIILGALFLGICTPTESAVIAVLYSLVIGLFGYRELKLKELPKLLINCALNSAKVLYIVSTAALFAWVISYARIPQEVLKAVLDFSTNPNIVLLLIIAVLLVMGCVMEATPIMLITIPMFLPIIKGLGLDVYHFGIVLCVTVCIGFITPPFGTLLFTGMSVGKVTMQGLVAKIVPMIIVMIIVLLLIAFIPQIVMFVL